MKKIIIMIFFAVMLSCNSGGNSDTKDKAAAPVFSPPAGTFSADINVEISCATAGADIYYTDDGTEPTSDSAIYSGPVPVSGNGTAVTIKAIASKSGMKNSGLASADYSINYDYNAVYIDPSAGSTGDGTYASPFKTWAEVTFAAGKAYRQKRGTIAREQITLTVSGTADNPIIIEAYGSGALPIIQGSEIETGWIQVGATNIYQKSIDTTLGIDGFGMAAEDGTPLNHLTWNTDVTTTFSGASAGSYSFDYDNEIIYAWCTDNADPDTHTMEISRRYFGINGNNVSYITINNMHVRYTSVHGIVFAGDNVTGCSNITVSSCNIEKLGGAVIIDNPLIIQAGNAIEFGNSSSNCTVQNCTISDIFDSGISPQTYYSDQTSTNHTFSNCTITRCGFSAVEIAILGGNGQTGCTMSNITVQNITMVDGGKGWSGIRWGNEGRGIKVDAAATAGTISNVLIDQCTISGSAGSGIYISGEPGVVTVKRCKIENNELDGVEVNSTGTTIGLNLSSSIIQGNGNNSGEDDRRGVFYHCPNGQGFNIYHNTFYNNAATDTASIVVGGQAVTANLKNNVFHASDARAHFFTYYTLTGASIENNFFTEFGAAYIIGYDVAGTPAGYTTAAGFNTGQGFASNNKGNTSPGLNPDFTIQNTSSPCWHAGVNTTGITTDYSGATFDNPPSIGAYEYP